VALGAKKSTRGRRDIVVDGNVYYWRVVGDDRRSMRDGKVGVVIGEARRPHRRVKLTGAGLSWTVFVLGVAHSHSKVTPRLVRQVILFAHASGWPEQQPTLHIDCARGGALSTRPSS